MPPDQGVSDPPLLLVSDVKRQAGSLAQEIATLVLEYEKRTGVKVSKISIDHVYQGNATPVPVVFVSVEL